MAPRARPGLRAGWAAPAGGSWPLKAGRGLCAVCAVRARAGALCFAPDGKKIQIHAINAQHPQTPRCVRELRELGACAVAQPRSQEARARLAGVRRERGVGASDNPELRQHAEAPVVVKAAAVVAVAAVPTTAAVIAATMSELSRIITREERAERRGSARTRRHRRQRSPCGAMPARAGVQLVDGGAVCGGEHGMRTCDNCIISRVTTVAQRRGQWLLSCITRMSCWCNGYIRDDSGACKRNDSNAQVAARSYYPT